MQLYRKRYGKVNECTLESGEGTSAWLTHPTSVGILLALT